MDYLFLAFFSIYSFLSAWIFFLDVNPVVRVITGVMATVSGIIAGIILKSVLH